jgi:non-specific serine/threonine protein kinase
MPLAIELAAARLRSMALAELAGRLDQRFRLLTGGSRTALPRQQTLEATVRWSYSLLDPTEQLLLCRLSVFAGGFDLRAAETVCGYADIDRRDVVGLLGSLVDKSLVMIEPGPSGLRYRLLETIRLFAAERFAGSGAREIAAAASAHSAHYLAVVEDTAAPHLTGPDLRSWLDRVQAEQANLQRAFEHAAADPDATAQVLRFAIALKDSDFALRYGIEAMAGLLLPVLQRPDAAADPALLAAALHAASALVGSFDTPASVRLAEQMDQVVSELGDNRLLALSRERLAFAYFNTGDLERARTSGQESVELARTLGDDVQLARSLGAWIVTFRPARGLDPGTAGSVYEEAIACTERSGDLAINCAMHHFAALYRLDVGDLPAARTHLEAAIRAAEEIGGPGDPELLDSLGCLLQAEHDFDGARSAYQDALRLSRRGGLKGTVAGALLHLAILAADTGDWHKAATLHGAASALAEQVGLAWDPDAEAYRHGSLGQIAAALGDDQLKQVYTQGATRSLDHSIDLALGKPNEL